MTPHDPTRKGPQFHPQRRRQVRSRAVPPVLLITVASRLRGTLHDLSLAGARVHLSEGAPRQGRDVLLRWGRFEAFGQIVWSKGMMAGIAFHQPIAGHCLTATVGADASMDIEHDARDWRRV